MKFEIEIDPALLKRDGQEYEPVAFGVPKAGDVFLSNEGHLFHASDPTWKGEYLILRPKAWRPKEGEMCLFLHLDGGLPTLKTVPWSAHGNPDRATNGTCWPISRRQEAEACVERVKKAIGGEA